MSDFQSGDDDQVVEDVGHHLGEENAGRRAADGLGRADVVDEADLLGRGAHDHGEAVPDKQAQDHDDDIERSSDQGDNGEGHQYHGHGQTGGDQKTHDHVDPATEVPGKNAQGDANKPRNDHGGDPDEEGDAGAVHEAA